jgi:hypothetical protein
LQYVATIPLPTAGQEISWDRNEPGALYSINRKTKEVVVSRRPPAAR